MYSGADPLAGWWDRVGCPNCLGRLAPEADGALLCPSCRQRFERRGCVLRLLSAARAAALDEWSRSYREARLRDGWQPLAPEQLLALPFASPAGYSALYWQVRRQTYRALRRLLAERGLQPGNGPIADLGAGVGWLSFRLAVQGFRVLAVDASLDEAFGLGAGRTYLASTAGRLLLVQGDLERPPLQPGRWGAVLFNASLHYAADVMGTLERAAQALQPRGLLVVMDTPIAPHPTAGTGRGDRHLGRRELEGVLRAVGLQVHWSRIVRGPRWWAHQARTWLKRADSFSFPLVFAQRKG
jgi:SAM-dependent methyltransferase